MAKVIIDHSLCDLCGLCVEYCPTYVFYVSDNKVYSRDDNCIECYACIPLCPKRAIKIIEPDP